VLGNIVLRQLAGREVADGMWLELVWRDLRLLESI
jgi:hypothetical protein